MTGPNPLDYGWWLASRSAGVVSLVAVSVSVLLGLLMANGMLRKPGMKRRLMTLHESTALVGLVAIAVHGLTLLGDSFIHPTLANIAIPFTIAYRPFYTGLGIIAGWGAVILGLSYYVRRHIGTKRWRTLHRATIGVWALGVIHTLGGGTDAGQVWMQALLLVTGIPIVFLFVRRLLPENPAPAAGETAADRSRARRLAAMPDAPQPTPRPAEEAVR